MGMIGHYVRVSTEDLNRVLRDPSWGNEFVIELEGREYEAARRAASSAGVGGPATAQAPRALDVDKAWHGLAFLLDQVGFEVDVVFGEQPVPGAGDWGYGPPRYLPPNRVKQAGLLLASTPFEQLNTFATLDDLANADVYPQIWDEPESLDYLRENYEFLVPFFRAAAQEGEVVLTWLA